MNTSLLQKIQQYTLNFFFLMTLLYSGFSFAANELSVTATLGTTGPTTYSSLTGAAGVFAAINAGTHRGVITITVNGSESAETGANTLAASGTGSSSYTSILIYTSGTYTISGSVSGVMIPLNGADNVTIDGRVSQTGSTVALTFDNTAATASGNIALKLYGTATSNTISYCTFKSGNSSVTGSSAGVINIGGGASCDVSNTISYCNVTKTSGQSIKVGISGALSASGGNTLNYNNIYDFQQMGVYLYDYVVGWTITNNSFYQTSSITLTANMEVISLDQLGGNVITNTITGNYIGGQAASCGGSTFTLSSSAYTFTGITVSAYGSGTNTISANTIQNITQTYTGNSTPFIGIETSYLGTGPTNFTIGSSSNGNVIGATSGTGSININLNTGTPSNGFTAFYLGSSSSNHTVAYNTVGAISITSTAVSGYGRGAFNIMYFTGNGTCTVNNNTIGNTTANNLSYSSTTGNLYSHTAMYLAGSGSITPSVYSNTVQNFYSNVADDFTGLWVTNSSVNGASVYSNTFTTLTTQAGDIKGIYLGYTNTGTFNIYSNTCTSFSSAGQIYGIHCDGTSGSPTINIYKNMMTSCASTSSTASDWNIHIYVSQTSATASTYIYNNINISSDGTSTVAKTLRGIIDYTAGTSYIYHNTVKLSATYTSGTGISSAYSCTYSGGTHYVKNNIWQNTSSGGTGKHVAQRYSSAPTVANIGYNYNQAPNTSEYCYWNGSLVTWTQWQTGGQTPGITTELNGSITLDATGKASASTTIGSAGTAIGAVTTDYAGTARNGSTPWIGAYESASSTSYYWVGGTGNWSDYATHWATSSGGASFNSSAPTSSDDVYFDGNSGGGTMTINATANAKSITCTGYTGTWSGSSALNCYGSLILVSGMTNSYSGTITMAATSGTNTLTSGTKTLANLTINGTGGTFTASDATTISGTFTMSAGTFNVGNSSSALTMQTATYSQTGGTFNVVGSSATANQILTVTGNFTLATGGVFDLNAQASNYSGRLNVAGNFTHSGTTFQATRSSLTYCLIYLNGTSGTQTLESTGQTGTIAWSVGASNAQCNIASSKSFTLAAAASFVVGGGTSTPDLLIDGTFVNSSAVAFTMTGTGTVSATGTYTHAVAAGTVPQMTWASASICKITGATTAKPAGITNTGAQTNMFGNLVWDCANQSAEINFASAGSNWTTFVLEGGLTVSNTNSQNLIIGGDATNVSRSFTVKGDLAISGATSKFVITEYWDEITLNVYGEITVNAGYFYGESATYTNTGTTINAEKGFVVSNSGVFKAQNQTSSNTGYLTLNFSNGQAGNYSSTLTFGTSFTRYGEARWDINIASGRTVTLGSNIEMGASRTFAVQSGGILIIPEAYIICINTSGTAATGTVFNLNSGGTLKVANTAGIVLTASATGAIQTTTRTFNSAGNIEFNGSSAQVTGTAFTNASNLVINNSNGVSLSASATISGTFTLTSGTLTIGAYTLTLSNNSAPVRTSGNIDATNASAEIAFTNTSGITLPTSLFSGSISKFKMNGTGGVTLPENTTISGTLTLTSGKLTVTGGTTLSLGTTSANVTLSGGSSSSYIVAYDAGTIGYIKQFVNSITTYTFPMGDNSNYTPFTFTLNSHGGLSSAYLTVYTKPSKITGLNSSFTTYLNRYWEFSQSGMTSPNYNMTMTYVDGDIVGTEANLLPVKKSGTTWYKPTSATFTTGTSQGTGSVTTGTNTLTWNSLTTFSTGGGAGDQAVALPIKLVSFTGKKEGEYNELKWQTATETNNDFFTVEKTRDGKTFENIGNMNGAGNSNKLIDYQLTDYKVEKMLNYYRLKQTDFDGKNTYSDLITIDNTEMTTTKEVVMITNILGQEVNQDYRGLVVILYSDGSSEKVIR